MIELVLEAERALVAGRLDQAERLYWQAVEGDSRNAIAIVGLARVALERGDERTAAEFARRALVLDPENAAALRLNARLAQGRAGGPR
jgi:Tfp pilus assembly protein PilF